MIWAIASDDLPQHHERLWPFLEGFEARSHARTSAVRLWREMRSRERQTWVAGDFQAVCLTSIGPACLNIDYCAGERREEWAEDLDDTLTQWARELELKRIIPKVRRGWEPFGRSRGYRTIHVEMVKEI